MGGIEENGVWCEAFSVENCNAKNMQKSWEIMLNSLYVKYDVYFLLSCLGIRYKFSLFYTIHTCELHKSWQCH